MANYSFTVSGTPQQVCMSGSDDRFEIKSVVAGQVVPYRVRPFAGSAHSEPVFVGGRAGSCAIVSDDGDYVIEWSDTSECTGNAPVFTSIAVIDDSGVNPFLGGSDVGGLGVQILDNCDLVTKTVWYKTVYFELGSDGIPVETVLSDWKDSGIVCAIDQANCNPLIAELFGDGDLAALDGESFNDVSIYNPGCCEVVVDTSAGRFTIRAGEAGFEKRFACPVQIVGLSIAGDCDKSAVHFIFVNDGLG